MIKKILLVILSFFSLYGYSTKTVIAEYCYDAPGNCGDSCYACTTCYDGQFTYISTCTQQDPPPVPDLLLDSSCYDGGSNCGTNCASGFCTTCYNNGIYSSSCSNWLVQPTATPAPTPDSCTQYFSCYGLYCSDGSQAPGRGCYTPDTYIQNCASNCQEANHGSGAYLPPSSTGGGGGGGGGGNTSSGACSDECYSDDLRTNVGKDAQGVCNSGYSSVSHFCTVSNVGSTQMCNGNSYTCARGTLNQSWVPTANARLNGGYTNIWICDTNGNWVCQGSEATNCAASTQSSPLPISTSNPESPAPPAPTPTPLPQAWWQSKDADILAAGDVRSSIPSTCQGSCIPKLSLPGSGNYPGLLIYKDNISSGAGTISETGWHAESIFSGRIYDFNWYMSLLPSDIETVDCSLGCTLSNGDLIAKAAIDKAILVLYNGDVTLANDINLNNKKIAMLVNGKLTVNGRINLDKGNGFYLAIVKNDISIDPSVTHPTGPAIEGLFITNGRFSNGAGALKFYLRGSVVAFGGVTLGRDLGAGNATTPAETFEYAPDIILNFPQKLLRAGTIWREIAP